MLLEPMADPPEIEEERTEADDGAGVHGKRLERSHERLRAGEIHRPLRVGDTGKSESDR
jgi:hypothetical protein